MHQSKQASFWSLHMILHKQLPLLPIPLQNGLTTVVILDNLGKKLYDLCTGLQQN